MSENIDRYSRPLTYNPQTHPSFPSLPSINDLDLGYRRCPSCPRLLAPTESCADHERRPSFGLQLAEYQLPQDPYNKNAPMQRQAIHNIPSPVMSAGDTSSDSEPMYTPNVSRATSPASLVHSANAASHQRRRSSKVATRRDSRRESIQLDSISEQSKKKKKMEKEKACRGQQAACLTRCEDFFRFYCNFERQEQSGGNGNGAGLTANKINVLRAMEVTVQLCLHEKRCAAMRNGPKAVAEFEKMMQALLTAAPDQAPFAGTFLSGSDEPCSHRDPKSKDCTTHGTNDWRKCRVLQSQARFEDQQTRWMQANLPRDQHRANL